MSCPRFITLLVIAALTAAGHSSAQTTAVPAAAVATDPIGKLRQEFETSVRKASASLNDYYDRRLASLEADLVAEGDYAQARMVKMRRDDIATANKASAATTTTTGPAAVLLPPDTAKLIGVQARSNGELQGWRTATSAAEWTLPKLAPGNYRLELSYSMDDVPAPSSGVSRPSAAEAEFAFREVTLLSSSTKNVLPVTIAANKGVMTTVQVPGVLQLTRASVTLRLASTASYSLNVIVFRDLKLVPVAPTDTPVASAPVMTVAGEFKKLQDDQASRLLSIRKPLVDTYLAQLADLARGAKDDVADAIEAEQRRASKLATTAALSKTNSMGLDGFEDISDVRYVADPANTGDHFKVEHGSTQFRVRLAWVACPPVDASDKRVLKNVMDRFGVDPTVAVLMGGSAKEFTELYLQARPLRLLVRTKKNPQKDEEPQVLVFLEDIGLFQNVLIDNGFAIADLPNNPTKNGVEAALQKSFEDREAAAKKHTPAQGGWALGTKGGADK